LHFEFRISNLTRLMRIQMGCLYVFLALLAPRVFLFFAWLLTDWFSRAYETTIWPLLGFLFMPYTTLAYMAAMLNNNHQLSGWWIVLLVIGVLADLGSDGEACRSSAKKKGRAGTSAASDA
jgi:hypothetical protein